MSNLSKMTGRQLIMCNFEYLFEQRIFVYVKLYLCDWLVMVYSFSSNNCMNF